MPSAHALIDPPFLSLSNKRPISSLSKETERLSSSRNEGRRPKDEGREGIRRTLRILFAIGLLSDRTNWFASCGGRFGKRYSKRKFMIVDKLSSRFLGSSI